MYVTGSNSKAAANVPLPAHRPGDLLLLTVRRQNASVPVIPTPGGDVPAWINIQSGGANSQSIRTVYAIATSSSHVSGTFSGTNHLTVTVIRPGAALRELGIGASSQNSAASTLTLVYPALTYQRKDGTSSAYRAGIRNTGGVEVGAAPPGWSVLTVQPEGAGALLSSHGRGAVIADEAAATVNTPGVAGPFRAVTVEVTETRIPPPPGTLNAASAVYAGSAAAQKVYMGDLLIWEVV